MRVDREYWLNRWIENRIGFHLTEVNPLLDRFIAEVAVPSARVLVPLCGKSLDLAWLAGRGYDVTGVELSLIAAQALIPDSEPRVEAMPFTVLRKERMALYVGDFFRFTPETAGKFDLIYDRAALIAIRPEDRPAYAGTIRSILAPGGRVLLIGLEYDQRAIDGPPFAVSDADVRTHFAGMKIDKLFEYDCLETEPRFKERGLTWMKETVYRLGEPHV